MGFDDETATFYLIDAARGQWPPDDVRTAVVTCARNDPAKTVIRLPQDPAQAGVDQAEAYSRLLAGYPVHIETVSTDIIARAFELIAAVNVGRVKMLAGPWNGPLLEEMRTFPKGTNDDQISGGADAFTELANGGGIATDATERAAVLGMKIKEKFF